jgi:HEAT repeat protein
LKTGADPPAALDALVAELKSDDRQARIRAFRLISDSGPQARAAVGPLKELLKDERPHVREAAEKALQKIQPASKERSE